MLTKERVEALRGIARTGRGEVRFTASDMRDLCDLALTGLGMRPQFDAMKPAQEELAIKFCCEIAGLLGRNPSPPDPVRLLEMAEELYKAEMP